MMVSAEEVLVNYVLVVVVICRVRVLSGILGYRDCRCPNKFRVKSFRLTEKLHEILSGLSAREEAGIHGVAVKCVDIVRNTNGELS